MKHMKRLFLRSALPLLMVAALPFFASCSCNKENPVPPTPEEGEGVVELPKESNLEFDDLVLYGDGKEFIISDDGRFSAGGENVIVLGKNSQLVYMSYGCGDDDTVINASETAVSLVLPLIPFVLSEFDDDALWILKQMIARLDQTKELAEAIEVSIKKYGYTNMDFIQPQIKAVVQEIKHRLGLDDISTNDGPRKRVSYPYFTDYPSGEAYGDGFYITITESELKPDEHGRMCWACKFNILNGNRFCYTALVKGKDDGKDTFRFNPSTHEVLSNLIKPMNVSAFMDFGTLSDIARDPKDIHKVLTDRDFDRVIAEFWEPLKNLKHVLCGEDIETVSYDKVKVKGAKLNFYSADESICIIGPGASPDVLAINIIKIAIQPVLKLILKDEKADGQDDISVKFYTWLSKTDPVFVEEILHTALDKEYNMIQKIRIIVPKLAKKFWKYVSSGALSEFIGILADESLLMKGYDDPAVKAIFTAFDSIMTAGDLFQLFLDINYYAVGFDLTQGIFDEYGALDDVPGQDL